MADFRKWLFALAVVALLAGFTVPASAQIPSTPVCSSQVATNNLGSCGRIHGAGWRSYRDLHGWYSDGCGLSGSAGRYHGYFVAERDQQDHRLRSSGGVFLEALLIIDEPNSPINPTRQILNCGAPGAVESSNIGAIRSGRM